MNEFPTLDPARDRGGSPPGDEVHLGVRRVVGVRREEGERVTGCKGEQ